MSTALTQSPVAAKTVVLEARCDARSLAVILSYYVSSGMAARTRSELIGAAIDDLASIIVEHKLGQPITDTGEALRLLQEHFGPGSMNHGGRGRFNQIKQMQAEDVAAGNARTFEVPSVRQTKQRKVAATAIEDLKQSGFDFDLAVRLIEEDLAAGDAKLRQGLAGVPAANDVED
jgi:hypothetical protein